VPQKAALQRSARKRTSKGVLGPSKPRSDVRDAEECRNNAIVLIGPGAVSVKSIALCCERFKKERILIQSAGYISADEISERKLVDQHFHRSASLAMQLNPSQLQVPESKFMSKFGQPWRAAVKDGLVFNAGDCVKKFKLTELELGRLWTAVWRAYVCLFSFHFPFLGV